MNVSALLSETPSGDLRRRQQDYQNQQQRQQHQSNPPRPPQPPLPQQHQAQQEYQQRQQHEREREARQQQYKPPQKLHEYNVAEKRREGPFLPNPSPPFDRHLRPQSGFMPPPLDYPHKPAKSGGPLPLHPTIVGPRTVYPQRPRSPYSEPSQMYSHLPPRSRANVVSHPVKNRSSPAMGSLHDHHVGPPQSGNPSSSSSSPRIQNNQMTAGPAAPGFLANRERDREREYERWQQEQREREQREREWDREAMERHHGERQRNARNYAEPGGFLPRQKDDRDWEREREREMAIEHQRKREHENNAFLSRLMSPPALPPPVQPPPQNPHGHVGHHHHHHHHHLPRPLKGKGKDFKPEIKTPASHAIVPQQAHHHPLRPSAPATAAPTPPVIRSPSPLISFPIHLLPPPLPSNSFVPSIHLGLHVYPRLPFPFFDFPEKVRIKLDRTGAPIIDEPPTDIPVFAIEREVEREVFLTVLIPHGCLYTEMPTMAKKNGNNWRGLNIWGGGVLGGTAPALAYVGPRATIGGRRVYTDDSDMVLCVLHAGFIDMVGMRKAKEDKCDLKIEVRLTKEGRFIGGFGAAVPGAESAEDVFDGRKMLSGGWGNGHDGAGMEILAVQVVPAQACTVGIRNRKQRLAEYAERRNTICPLSNKRKRSAARLSYGIELEDSLCSNSRVVVFSGVLPEFKYDPQAL